MQTQYALERRAGRSAIEEVRERLLAVLPLTETRLDISGISTAVLEGGDGPPVVLLHGPGEFAAKWLRVLPELIETHHVVAPDLPGHGESHVSEGELDADRVLTWLGELIERTCASPPTLVGHVLGGAIAARFAVRHGDRIARLVLVDSLGLAPFRPSPRFVLGLLHFIARPSERTFVRFLPQCLYDLDGLREQMGERWQPLVDYSVDRARAPSVKSALGVLMRQVGLPAIPPADLSRVAVPTTLIWGRHDRANRLRIAQEARNRYGWGLHVIENSGDDPGMEQPAAFLQALRSTMDGR